jgi:fimbrial chaperone protein
LPAKLACAAALFAATGSPAIGAGLRVEPVLLNLEAPVASSFVTLHNGADKEMAVQARVFHWSIRNNEDILQPASGVAVSPPIAQIAPGEDYTVRVVRIDGSPVAGEEAYRLWIDELPDGKHLGRAGLNMLIRQSIPVFFHAQDMSPPSLVWSARMAAGKLVVEAQNSGDQHMRIVSLQLRDSTGKTVSFGSGLIGYVLGHSSLTFTAPHPPHGFGAHGAIAIAAEGNTGKFDATAQLQSNQ